MIEVPFEAADPEGQRAQLDDQVPELGLGHLALDLVPAVPAGLGFEAEDLAAPAADQAVDLGGEIRRHVDGHLVDRLEQDRRAVGQAFGHGHAAGGLERLVGAVDRMVLTVEQGDREVDHRKAERPALQVVLGAVLDRRDVLPGHRAADDLVDELEALAARQRLDLHLHVAELAVAAGLALETRVLLRAFADGLLVGGLGLRHLDRDVEFALQALGGDLQVDLALAPEQHLVGVRVVLHRDRAVLLDQLGDAAGQLDVVLPVERLDGEGEDGFGPIRPEHARIGHAPRRGQEIAGLGLLHAPERDHLALAGPVDLPVVPAHHVEQAGDALAADGHAVAQRAAPDAGEGHAPGVRQVQDSEHRGDRALTRGDPETLGGRGRLRRLVTQRLP